MTSVQSKVHCTFDQQDDKREKKEKKEWKKGEMCKEKENGRKRERKMDGNKREEIQTETKLVKNCLFSVGHI